MMGESRHESRLHVCRCCLRLTLHLLYEGIHFVRSDQ
jgi:hypothetical protein